MKTGYRRPLSKSANEFLFQAATYGGGATTAITIETKAYP
jgi:hypothetical protein